MNTYIIRLEENLTDEIAQTLDFYGIKIIWKSKAMLKVIAVKTNRSLNLLLKVPHVSMAFEQRLDNYLET